MSLSQRLLYGNSQSESPTLASSAITVAGNTTILVVREGSSVSTLTITLPAVRQSLVGRLIRILRSPANATTVVIKDESGSTLQTITSAGSVDNIEVYLTDYNGGTGSWEIVVPSTTSVTRRQPLNVIMINYDDCGRHQLPTYYDLNSWPAGYYHLYPQMPWTQDRCGTVSDQGTEAGTRFVNARVSARCTPTRQCLATGRQPHVSQTHPWGSRVGNIPQQGGVTPEFRTIKGITRDQNPFPVVARNAGAPHYFFHIGKIHATEHEIRDDDSDYVSVDGFGVADFTKADEIRTNFKQVITDFGFDESYKLELAKPDGAETEPYKGYRGTWSGDGADTTTRDARTFSVHHIYSDTATAATGWSVNGTARLGSKVLPIAGGSGQFKKGDRIRVSGVNGELIVWEDSGASPTQITLYQGLLETPRDGASITVVFHIVGDDVESGELYGGNELGGMRRAGFTQQRDPGQGGASLILATGGTLTERPDILTSSITVHGTETSTSTDYGEDPYYFTYELTKIKECIDACASRNKPFFIEWWTHAPHGTLPAIESNIGPNWSRCGVAADGTTYFFTDAQHSGGVTPEQSVATGMHREADSVTGRTFSAAEVQAMCRRYLRTFKDEVVDGIDVSDPQHPLIQQGIYATASLDGRIRISNLYNRDKRYTVSGNTASTEPQNFGPGYDADGNWDNSSPYGPLGQISVAYRRMIANMESIDRGCQMLDDWLQLNYPEVHANTLWVIHADNGPTESDASPRADSWASHYDNSGTSISITGGGGPSLRTRGDLVPTRWTTLRDSEGDTAVWDNYSALPPCVGGRDALTDQFFGWTSGVDSPDITYHNPDHSKNQVNDDGILTHLSVWGYNLHEGGNDATAFIDACDFYKFVLDIIDPGSYDVALSPEGKYYAQDSVSFAPSLADPSFVPKTSTLHQIFIPSGGSEGNLRRIERCVIDVASNYKLMRRYNETLTDAYFGGVDNNGSPLQGVKYYRIAGGTMQFQLSEPTIDVGPVEDGEPARAVAPVPEPIDGDTVWDIVSTYGVIYVRLIAEADDTTGAILDLWRDAALTTPVTAAGFTATSWTEISTAGNWEVNFKLSREESWIFDPDNTGWFLYNLNDDPRETTNLYGADGYDNVVSLMRNLYLDKVGNLD